MKWGRDNEERSAVAQKAHDAYAAAREAMGRVDGAEAVASRAQSDVSELRGLVTRLTAELAVARRDIATLRRQFDEATDVVPLEPVVVPAVKSAVITKTKQRKAGVKKPTKAKFPALVGKAKLMAGKGQGKPGGAVASGSEYPTGSFGGGKVTDRGVKRK